MNNFKNHPLFIKFSQMNNEQRGEVIHSHKDGLEDMLNVDLVIHSYNQTPNNDNPIFSYKVKYSHVSALFNLVEFKPR